MHVMFSLAQTMPGTEFVPVALFFSIVGWIAALASLFLSIPRATRRLALALALPACASAVIDAVFLFMAHEFSLADTASAISRHWLVFLIIDMMPLVLGAVAVAVLRSPLCTREIPLGHCQKCGYNLTGLSEPRCPECGRPFDPSMLSVERGRR